MTYNPDTNHVDCDCAQCKLTVELRELRRLRDHISDLREMGAVVVLVGGDELELSPEALDNYLTSYAERCEEAANEAYYGGDGPPGCYGPDDTR